MKPYIQTLGGIIEKQTLRSPQSARQLLNAAYSWVRFSSCRSRKPGVRSAYDRMNAAVAGTLVDSFRRPKQAVMVNIFFPCEMIHALGLQPMFPEGLSAYLACTACQHVFSQAAEEAGVPESFCSYHKTLLGAGLTGVMPAPLLIANTTLACDANQLSFRQLAGQYQVPHVVIDVPDQINEDAVGYVADQLRAAAAQMEALSGRKLDPDALAAAVDRSRRTIQAQRAFLAARGQVSLNTTMTGELCSLIANHVMLGRPEAEEYLQRLLSCAKAAPPPDRGRRRVFWMHTLPNWQDSMKELVEGDRCELVGTDLAIDYLGEMDPERPYESMAHRVVYSINNGPAQRRIQASLETALQAGAEGVIVFCHWGCKQTLGLSQLAKETFEAHGLPTLVLDGDGCDSRNVADGQMSTRVSAFLEQLEGTAP